MSKALQVDYNPATGRAIKPAIHEKHHWGELFTGTAVQLERDFGLPSEWFAGHAAHLNDSGMLAEVKVARKLAGGLLLYEVRRGAQPYCDDDHPRMNGTRGQDDYDLYAPSYMIRHRDSVERIHGKRSALINKGLAPASWVEGSGPFPRHFTDEQGREVTVTCAKPTEADPWIRVTTKPAGHKRPHWAVANAQWQTKRSIQAGKEASEALAKLEATQTPEAYRENVRLRMMDVCKLMIYLLEPYEGFVSFEPDAKAEMYSLFGQIRGLIGESELVINQPALDARIAELKAQVQRAETPGFDGFLLKALSTAQQVGR